MYKSQDQLKADLEAATEALAAVRSDWTKTDFLPTLIWRFVEAHFAFYSQNLEIEQAERNRMALIGNRITKVFYERMVEYTARFAAADFSDQPKFARSEFGRRLMAFHFSPGVYWHQKSVDHPVFELLWEDALFRLNPFFEAFYDENAKPQADSGEAFEAMVSDARYMDWLLKNMQLTEPPTNEKAARAAGKMPSLNSLEDLFLDQKLFEKTVAALRDEWHLLDSEGRFINRPGSKTRLWEVFAVLRRHGKLKKATAKEMAELLCRRFTIEKLERTGLKKAEDRTDENTLKEIEKRLSLL